MGNTVTVTFYKGLRKNAHIMDHVVQPEVPVAWEPGLADIQQRNVRDLMSLANVSPSAWREYLLERFAFDVFSPTPQSVSRLGVMPERIGPAMLLALDQMENWKIERDIDDLWAFDDDRPQNLTPAQVYEVLAETGARGTPVICFQADEDDVMAAFAEDNLVTLKARDGVFVGLSDPFNGYNWSPEGLKNEIVFRPSSEGLLVIGDDHLMADVVHDAYLCEVTFAEAPKLRLSSRSEETSRLPPPEFRDTRASAVVGGTPRP